MCSRQTLVACRLDCSFAAGEACPLVCTTQSVGLHLGSQLAWPGGGGYAPADRAGFPDHTTS
jgi:hypothetical protein